MKLFDVKLDTYITSRKEINDKDPKFKIGDIVIISKYKNIFANGYVPKQVEEDIVLTKFKNAVLISGIKDEEIVEMFHEKELQKKSKRVQS